MRVARPVELDQQQQETLEQIARGRSLPARLVERARIVLRAASGMQDQQIASELAITPEKAARWRNRYLDGGVDALEKDASRPGRPRTITGARTAEVIRKTTQERPFNATHWSTRTMAAATGLSETTVRRIWRANGLKPHLVKTFKVSNDARFADLIVDNYATHKHPKVQRWLARHPRFQVHFTPTSSSWLNVVERFFRDLTQNRLRRGVFHDAEELIMAIGEFIDKHNQNPKPFIWTAKAFDILEKVKRARRTLDNRHSA
jgi:transposase